jgi:hypothetical protein
MSSPVTASALPVSLAPLSLASMSLSPLGAASSVARASVPGTGGDRTTVVPEPVHRVPLTRPSAPVPVPGLAADLRGRSHRVRSVLRRPVPSTVDSTRPAVARPASLTEHRTAPEPVGAGRVDDLPVLGGAPVAVPDTGFGASAAVTLPPAAPSPVAPVPAPAARMRPSAGGPGHRTRPESLVVARSMASAARVRPARVEAANPEARWRAAVRSRPLENQRPFPSALRPLVESLAGGAQRASYTTGPATRHALASAGALGASTGSVVHLPTAPTAVRLAGAATGQRVAARPEPLLGIIAHELAHARQPVSRPRFMLGIPHGVADTEERAAQAIGQRVQAAGDAVTSTGAGMAAGIGAGIVGDLPVGGLGRVLPGGGRIPDVDGMLNQAVAGHLPQVDFPQVPDMHLPGGATAALEEAGGAVTHAASALTGSATSAVHALSGAAANALGGLDIDHLAEVLEQRVLRQIERRGGRYTGMF